MRHHDQNERSRCTAQHVLVSNQTLTVIAQEVLKRPPKKWSKVVDRDSTFWSTTYTKRKQLLGDPQYWRYPFQPHQLIDITSSPPEGDHSRWAPAGERSSPIHVHGCQSNNGRRPGSACSPVSEQPPTVEYRLLDRTDKQKCDQSNLKPLRPERLWVEWSSHSNN